MKKSIMATVLLFLVLEVASAETSYDLAKIVELTMKENATIKRNSIELSTLKRKSDKRWAAVVPSLSAGVGTTRNEDSAGFVNTANATLSMSLSASSFSDIGQARSNYEAGLLTGASTAREVELSVRKSFFLILYEQEYVDYLKRTVDTARRQYELTVINQQEGLVPILDTLSAKVNYQNATLTLASAESSCRNDISALKQTAGIPQIEDVRLIGSLESSLPKVLVGAERLRPSSSGYALLEKQLETARYARRIAGWSVWSPTLSCSVATRNFLKETGASAALSVPDVTVSIGFPVSDLMPWSAAKEAVLAADDSVRDIELQLTAMKTADGSKFESLLRDIRDAGRTIETRRLTVSLAEENYRLTEEAFKAGSKDFIALKSAADALQEAKTGLMKESYGLISSVMDLEYLCGVPFGSLSEEK